MGWKRCSASSFGLFFYASASAWLATASVSTSPNIEEQIKPLVERLDYTMIASRACTYFDCMWHFENAASCRGVPRLAVTWLGPCIGGAIPRMRAVSSVYKESKI